MPSTTSRKPASAGPAAASVLGHGELGTSLLFVFPLFLVYQVGVIFSPVSNGVDFVTRNLFALVGHDRTHYLLLQGGLAAAFVVLILWLRGKKKLEPRRFLPMVLEATIVALTLGTLIVFVMTRILHVDPSLAAGRPSLGVPEVGAAQGIMLSFGAGVHEELVFRLGVLAGGAALVKAAGAPHGAAMAIMFVVSSALFSAVHHLGSLGDPWALGVFTYRTLAGLVFATIFYFRSLAHATYTHALYDVYVMVLH